MTIACPQCGAFRQRQEDVCPGCTVAAATVVARLPWRYPRTAWVRATKKVATAAELEAFNAYRRHSRRGRRLQPRYLVFAARAFAEFSQHRHRWRAGESWVR